MARSHLRLRELHAAMDRAVLDAYGWGDLVSGEWRVANGGADSSTTRDSPIAIRPLTCQFLLDYEEDDEESSPQSPISNRQSPRRRRKPWRYRWPDEVRDEVLARLLALNAARHQEEVRLGLAPGMKGAKKKLPPQRKKSGDEMV